MRNYEEVVAHDQLSARRSAMINRTVHLGEVGGSGTLERHNDEGLARSSMMPEDGNTASQASRAPDEKVRKAPLLQLHRRKQDESSSPRARSLLTIV